MADLPCPNCGGTLTYIEQYQRLYCSGCGQYAPEGYGDQGARKCPTCKGILTYVVQYNRFYCYKCNEYGPEEPNAQPRVEATSATPVLAAGEAAVPATASPASVEPTVLAPLPSTEPTEKARPSEPSASMVVLAASKPAVVRVKVFALKKSELADLCAAYHLDSSGAKDQLQERLLQHLLKAEEIESLERSEAPTPPAESVPAVTIVPESPKSESAAPEPTSSEPTTQTASLSQLEAPKTEPIGTASGVPSPTPTIVVSIPTPAVVEVSQAAPKVTHPCPTCGRELTFIAQYNRDYCYACQRYASAALPKNACPSCGTRMHWIDQYQRWWCDACQKYGPADLPKPSKPVASKPAAVGATTQIATRPTSTAYAHHSRASGVGLIGFGLALFVLVEFFTVLAPLANLAIGNPFTTEMAALTQFFAFLFVAAGAMLGLSALRDRP